MTTYELLQKTDKILDHFKELGFSDLEDEISVYSMELDVCDPKEWDRLSEEYDHLGFNDKPLTIHGDYIAQMLDALRKMQHSFQTALPQPGAPITPKSIQEALIAHPEITVAIQDSLKDIATKIAELEEIPLDKRPTSFVRSLKK